jgi:hypothetical protein
MDKSKRAMSVEHMHDKLFWNHFSYFLQHQEAKWSGNFKYPRRHTFIHVFVSTLKIRDQKKSKQPGKKGTSSQVRTQAAGSQPVGTTIAL